MREPFPCRWSQAGFVFGQVGVGDTLRIRSLMPEGGVIVSDGIEADGLDFRSGLAACIWVAGQRGHVLT